jgi:uncharacterized protein (TIGR02246 family)
MNVVPTRLAVETLSAEQSALWDQVCQSWEGLRSRDRTLIGAGIHPQYVGWDMSAELPHDKEAAVASATDDSPELIGFALSPLSIRVYDHMVGVVHYAYRAAVRPRGAAPRDVTGKWTEVYLRQGNKWMMIAVSGRPDHVDLMGGAVAARGEPMPESEDQRAIRAVVAEWMAATKRGDTDTVLDLMTDDAVFLVAGQPPMGKAAFKSAAGAPTDQRASFDAVADIKEVCVEGNVAYTWSYLSVTVTSPQGGESVKRAGHTLTIFQNVGGRWLLARDANLLVKV